MLNNDGHTVDFVVEPDKKHVQNAKFPINPQNYAPIYICLTGVITTKPFASHTETSLNAILPFTMVFGDPGTAASAEELLHRNKSVSPQLGNVIFQSFEFLISAQRHCPSSPTGATLERETSGLSQT